MERKRFKNDYNSNSIAIHFEKYPCEEYEYIFKSTNVNNVPIIICNYCNEFYSNSSRKYSCFLFIFFILYLFLKADSQKML